MEKDVRNLLITGVVACFVGIIMGIGVVAPSVETQEIAFVDGQCEENIVVIQGQFDQCIEQAQESQALAWRALENYKKQSDLLERCIEGLERTMTYESI